MFSQFLNALFQVLATIGIIIYASYWFAIPLVPILILYLIVLNIYRSSAREVKRLEGIARSPLCKFFYNFLQTH